MASVYDSARPARQCSPDTIVVPLSVVESVLADIQAGRPLVKCECGHEREQHDYETDGVCLAPHCPCIIFSVTNFTL